MLWNDVIELVGETPGENTMGDPITNKTYREVFANEKGIRQSEFYQAHAAGLKPSIMFEISKIDYNDEKKIRVNKKQIYNIIRTYPTKNEKMEIICEGMVNKNGNA